MSNEYQDYCNANYGPEDIPEIEMTERCPRCDSPAPHLHPAVQFEGEVETCTHKFHLTPTPQNTPEYIEDVHAKRASHG